MIAGLVVGILSIILLYIGTMSLYFYVRRKCTGAKYRIELCTIVFATVISIAIKAAVLFINNSLPSFGSSFANILFAIYSGLGGLTFEGLDALDEISSILLQCLYTGSSLYAGVMFVSVVTAKASYEIYSYVRLRIIRLKMWLNPKYINRRDIYIFTSATEDSLLLADSIRAKYHSPDIEPKRKSIIIFAGDELESFDKKNSLHREIMAKGYLYWSYFKSKSKKNQASLLKRFKLYINNDFTQEKDDEKKSEEKFEEKSTKKPKDNKEKKISQTRIHIFAFSNNEELSGLEATNSDIIFGEIMAMTREMYSKKKWCKKKPSKRTTDGEEMYAKKKWYKKEQPKRTKKQPKRTIVDFYILTDSQINYEYYKQEVLNRVREVLKDLDGKGLLRAESPEAEDISKLFQLSVINEAVIVGKCLGEERIKLLKELQKSKNEGDLLDNNKPIKNNTYRVMVLGFGKNGQEAMKSLIMDSAYVDENGVPSQFIADVYDHNINERGGIFAYTHPMFVCLDCGKEVDPFEPTAGKKPDYSKQKEMFPESIDSFDDVKKYMQFPIIAFHNVSCYEISFIEHLDKKTGSGSNPSNKFIYDAFIIALGSDEDNITIANALIDDIKHEGSRTTKCAKHLTQAIYVNIRDEKNYNRINWRDDAEKKRFPHLKVVKFGNREKAYSHNMIVNDIKEMKYHFGYGLINKEGSGSSKELEGLVQSFIFDKNAGIDYYSPLKGVAEKMAKIDELEQRKEWNKITTFPKESNNAVARFSPYYESKLSSQKVTYSDLKMLVHLEHTRWSRFHMANGWVYAHYENDVADRKERRNRKEHNFLCPFNMLPDKIKKNDLINIILALAKEEEINNDKQKTNNKSSRILKRKQICSPK